MGNINLKEITINLKKTNKYSICSCGLSCSLPFCDNAHRDFNTSNKTNYKSFKVIPNKDVTIDVTSSNWDLEKISRDGR